MPRRMKMVLTNENGGAFDHGNTNIVRQCRLSKYKMEPEVEITLERRYHYSFYFESDMTLQKWNYFATASNTGLRLYTCSFHAPTAYTEQCRPIGHQRQSTANDPSD